MSQSYNFFEPEVTSKLEANVSLENETKQCHLEINFILRISARYT